MKPLLKNILFGITKNLFIKITAVSGEFCSNADGTFNLSANYFRSDYIRVFPLTQYVQNYATANAVAGVAFYDINKTYISGFNTNTEKQYTTPYNCAYLVTTGRFNTGATANNFYLGVGSSL